MGFGFTDLHRFYMHVYIHTYEYIIYACILIYYIIEWLYDILSYWYAINIYDHLSIFAYMLIYTYVCVLAVPLPQTCIRIIIESQYSINHKKSWH